MATDSLQPQGAGEPPNHSDSLNAACRPRLEAIEKRAAEIRDLVFEAQSIVEVSRSAIDSGAPANEWASRKALEIASRLLESAAAALEPGAITQAGAFHVQ